MKNVNLTATTRDESHFPFPSSSSTSDPSTRPSSLALPLNAKQPSAFPYAFPESVSATARSPFLSHTLCLFLTLSCYLCRSLDSSCSCCHCRRSYAGRSLSRLSCKTDTLRLPTVAPNQVKLPSILPPPPLAASCVSS